VPALISVETDWLREVRVDRAAALRAVMMVLPGKMWAFTRVAQVQMRWWPEVYCLWTVPVVMRGRGQLRAVSSFMSCMGVEPEWSGGGRYVLPISPNFLSSNSRKPFCLLISFNLRTVRSFQSSMMSACVLSTHIESPTSSASCNSAAVLLTSAETQRFDLLTVMRCRR